MLNFFWHSYMECNSVVVKTVAGFNTLLSCDGAPVLIRYICLISDEMNKCVVDTVSEKHPNLYIAGMNNRITFAGAPFIHEVELHVASKGALNAQIPCKVSSGF